MYDSTFQNRSLSSIIFLSTANPCEPLDPPLNGAISCSRWTFGQQCQMQCNADYDIPLGSVNSNGNSFSGLFSCSESTGEYTPDNNPPDCTSTVTIFLKHFETFLMTFAQNCEINIVVGEAHCRKLSKISYSSPQLPLHILLHTQKGRYMFDSLYLMLKNTLQLTSENCKINCTKFFPRIRVLRRISFRLLSYRSYR